MPAAKTPEQQEVSEETARQMMEKAKDHVTIDEFMRRSPIKLGSSDYVTMVEVQRRERARYMVDDEAKKQKRKGN